jgi:hypothetical protein
VARLFRKLDIETPIRLAKKPHIPALFGREENIPLIDLETKIKLLSQYEQCILELEVMIDRALGLWREQQT